MANEKWLPAIQPERQRTTADTDPALKRVMARLRQLGLQRSTPQAVATIQKSVEETPVGRRSRLRIVH